MTLDNRALLPTPPTQNISKDRGFPLLGANLLKPQSQNDKSALGMIVSLECKST